MIPQETIEQIRAASDIVDVVGGYIRLKKRGRNFEALCPFHNEKTPSFKVSQDKQIFHCFGCGKGGNVFTFLMEHEKMSFVEAVRHLAGKANISIREEQSDARREQLERLNFAQQVALDYFRELLFSEKYKRVLEDYLIGRRGIQREYIEHFQLGLAGESWDGLIQRARKKNLSPAELETAGLAIKSDKRDSYYDRFRQRLMFPIFNLTGKPIAFGGRTLRKGDKVKYINSPETPLYSKGNVLYGLNFTRDDIRDKESVFVVEGYFDVISLFQAGVRNVVASSGTAFTEQQARLLARFANSVYLFFDADSAGQTAALRSVDALFDAGLEVKVLVPPEGEDPDSLANEGGRERIEELADDALDYIPYRVRDIDVRKAGIMGKEKLVKEMAVLGTRITDPTRRSLFYQEAADALGVDIGLLSTARPQTASKSGAIQPVRQNRVEFEFLSLLLNFSGSLDSVFEKISPEDFDSKQFSRLYAAMATQYEMDGLVDLNRLLEKFQDEEAVSQLTAMAAVDWDPDKVDVEIRRRVDDFVQRKKKRIRSKLRDDLRQAEADGDQQKAEAILQELKQYGL